MKYKVLLTGTNQTMISEFFNHMDFSFECLSSSVRAGDILGHLKYYHPDALVYCLYKETPNDISGLWWATQQLSAEKVPLIIVGDLEICELFEKTLPTAVSLTLRRPITTKGLEEKIFAYLEQYVQERETAAAEEKAAAEREKAAEAERLAAEQKRAEEAETEKNADGDFGNLPAFAGKAAAGSEDKGETLIGAAEEKRKRHILVIDDDSRVLKLVKGFLGEQYNVATAISGKVALKFLEKKETDLILLDYEMPEENGAQVLQKIRSDERLQKLPVVFLTGVSDRKRIQEVLKLDPQGYLLKPINTESLSEALRKVFGE